MESEQYTERFPADYGGGLAVIGQNRNGVRVGRWIQLHSDGTTQKISNYDENGKLHGCVQIWYSRTEGSGQRSVSHWDHGVVDGACEMFDPLSCGGSMIFSATYSGGVLHGPLSYHIAGDTIIENYFEGKPLTRIHRPAQRQVSPNSSDDEIRLRSLSDSDSDSDTEDASPRCVYSRESSPRETSNDTTVTQVSEQSFAPISIVSPRVAALRKYD